MQRYVGSCPGLNLGYSAWRYCGKSLKKVNIAQPQDEILKCYLPHKPDVFYSPEKIFLLLALISAIG
jgi:hypothetical protein